MTYSNSMDRLERNFIEKRDFVRMTLASPLLIKPQHATQAIEAICHNLSATGLAFDSPCPFQAGDELEILLCTSHDKFDDLRALVRVLRSELCPKTQTYQTAAQIKQLLTADTN